MAVKRIIAIGGGEIGRPKEDGGYYPIETTLIDREIISLSGKKHPKILFLPTASSDSEGYVQTIQKHFGNRLKCKIDVLMLIKKKYSINEIETKIFSSDIIYVGGGNTLKMMTIWRKLGVDNILYRAWKKGIVLCGLSAGAICWFDYGNSDSRKFTSNSTQLIKVKGLGFIRALCCPHYGEEQNREPDLKRMMKKERLVAIALSPCAALEVIDDKYRIIKSKKTAKAYKVHWQSGKYVKEQIVSSPHFSELNALIRK